jgi:hypothetical protein
MLSEPCVHPLRYRAYGLTLGSDVPFPELPPHAPSQNEGLVDIRVTLGAGFERYPVPIGAFASRRSASGEVWLMHARTKTGHLLRFPDLADYHVDAAGRQIAGKAVGGTAQETLRHLLLDQVLPLILTLHGRHALHATAVLTQAGVCAFTGPTGTGKSTLAASFQLAGVPVISDDCLLLEPSQNRIMACPAYPGVRLWEDTLEALCPAGHTTLPVAHYTSKRRPILGTSSPGFPAGRYPLVGIYSLSRATDPHGDSAAQVRIEPISRRDALIEALRGTFTLDSAERAAMLDQFRWLEQVVSLVPVRKLHVPNRFAALPFVRAAILADLGAS